ncbi:MAG: hypothetical protein ACOC2E_08790 [Bacteroidota bacterium]
MYQTHRIFAKPDMKMSDLIEENPRLLLLLEHFEIDFAVSDKTIAGICSENEISVSLFIILVNLYNGFHPSNEDIDSLEDILLILKFLKNSHEYYKNDKYPEIKGYIDALPHNSYNKEVKLIENFFTDYFNEVLEHLDYEDEIAFPYFKMLMGKKNREMMNDFSTDEYRNHHTDIETKLTDLKNLLLMHIKITDQLPLRRKLIFSLFEFEYDLQIHALIEEKILLPLIEKIEKETNNG